MADQPHIDVVDRKSFDSGQFEDARAFAYHLLRRDQQVVVAAGGDHEGEGAAVHDNIVSMVHAIEAKLSAGDGVMIIASPKSD